MSVLTEETQESLELKACEHSKAQSWIKGAQLGVGIWHAHRHPLAVRTYTGVDFLLSQAAPCACVGHLPRMVDEHELICAEFE